MGFEQRQELIGCNDCGGAVSLSAASCPHCGSREPSGPYTPAQREKRLHRIEEINDQTPGRIHHQREPAPVPEIAARVLERVVGMAA
jgi:hypothetical protein